MADTPKRRRQPSRRCLARRSWPSTPRRAGGATPPRSGGHEWEAASHEVGRIEVEIARTERAMDPPRV